MASVLIVGGDYRGWVNEKQRTMERMERLAWRVAKM
jgi:hypothetical protein